MKWLRRLLGWVLAVAGLAALWVAAHAVLGKREPKRLWSMANLPAVPAADENGWAQLRPKSLSRTEDLVDPDLADLLREGSWERVRAAADRIRALANGPATARRLEPFARALARPRFADGCSPEPDDDCPAIQILMVHRLFEIEILVAALDGAWSTALERCDLLLRADVDFVRTSRSVLTSSVALADLRSAVRVVGLLLDGLRQSPGAAAPLKAQLRGLLSRLNGSADRDIDIGRGVVFEYLQVLGAIAMVSDSRRPPPEEPGSSTLLSRYLLDPAACLDTVNPYFEALMKFAEGDASAAPPALPEVSGPGWWIYNPTGKIVLKVVLIDLSRRIRDFKGERTELIASRNALVARLRAAAE